MVGVGRRRQGESIFYSCASYENAQSSAIWRVFWLIVCGVVLRFTYELSPSVPHCRDVTEQPIIANERTPISINLILITRGLFVGGCVFDPSYSLRSLLQVEGCFKSHLIAYRDFCQAETYGFAALMVRFAVWRPNRSLFDFV